MGGVCDIGIVCDIGQGTESWTLHACGHTVPIQSPSSPRPVPVPVPIEKNGGFRELCSKIEDVWLYIIFLFKIQNIIKPPVFLDGDGDWDGDWTGTGWGLDGDCTVHHLVPWGS